MEDRGQQGDGAPASGSRVPIILVCSTSDVEIADGAASGLRSRGYDVAVMGAAEEGSARLSEVVERFERQGLYVLCRGGELDRDGVDALRSMLRNHDVPFGRTLTLATNQGGARGLEERVVSVARRMVTGRFQRSNMKIRPDGDAESSGLSPTPLLNPQEAPEPSEYVEEGDVDRWADSLANGQAPQLDIPEDLPTAVVGTPAEPPPAPEATDPGLLTDPSVPTSEDDYVRVDKTMVAHHPDPSLIEPEESSAPATTPASLPADDDDISASEFSAGPNLKLIFGVGGTALVLIIVLAIALSGPDDPEPSSSGAVATREDDEEPAAKKDEAKADQAEADEAKADEAKADEAKADETPEADAADEAPKVEEPDSPEPVAAEDETPEPVAESPELALDLEGAEKALSHRSSVDLALLDDSPLPPAAPEDRAAIAQALEEREIRSWNAFLLAGEDAEEMTFADAESFCRSLTAGGISGWRLPSIGELLSLNGAKMLDKRGIFWSETPGDAFGDTRIVVNAKKGSTSPVTVGWDGARPICIRVRE